MTIQSLEPGPICGVCPLFHTCNAICEPVENILPSFESGRVDAEDLPRLHMGIQLTNAILDNEEILTERQREVVQLYYRETLQQKQIADRLNISQQAVGENLQRARVAVGKYVQELSTRPRAKTSAEPSPSKASSGNKNTKNTPQERSEGGASTSHRRK